MNAIANFGSLNFTRGVVAPQPAVGPSSAGTVQTQTAGLQDQAFVGSETGDHSWDMSKARSGVFHSPTSCVAAKAETSCGEFLPPVGQSPANGMAAPALTNHYNGTLTVLDPIDFHSASFGIGLSGNTQNTSPSLADTLAIQQRSSQDLHQAQVDCQKNLTLAQLMKVVAQGHSAAPTVDAAQVQESSAQAAGQFSKMQSAFEMFGALSLASKQGPANFFQPSLLNGGR